MKKTLSTAERETIQTIYRLENLDPCLDIIYLKAIIIKENDNFCYIKRYNAHDSVAYVQN